MDGNSPPCSKDIPEVRKNYHGILITNWFLWGNTNDRSCSAWFSRIFLHMGLTCICLFFSENEFFLLMPLEAHEMMFSLNRNKGTDDTGRTIEKLRGTRKSPGGGRDGLKEYLKGLNGDWESLRRGRASQRGNMALTGSWKGLIF